MILSILGNFDDDHNDGDDNDDDSNINFTFTLLGSEQFPSRCCNSVPPSPSPSPSYVIKSIIELALTS